MSSVDDGRSAAWQRIPYRRRCKILKSAGIGRIPDAQVALDVGLCKATVRRYRERMRRPATAAALVQAKRRTRGSRSDGELAPRVRDLAKRGYSAAAMALRLGIGWPRVMRIVRQMGLDLGTARFQTEERREALAEGVRNRGRQAFDEWKARYQEASYGPLIGRMRELAAEGLTLAEVSRRLGEKPIKVLRAARVGGVRFARRGTRANLRRLADRIRPLAEAGLDRAEIARRLRVRWNRVDAAAKAWGIDVKRGGVGVDWSTVDWSRPNVEIAAELDLRREYVAAKRKELLDRGADVPKSPRRPRPWRPTIPVEEIDWTRSNASIASEHGVSLATVVRCRTKLRELGRSVAPARRKGTDWSAVDWRATDEEIAQVLGLKPATVHVRRWALRRQGEDVPQAPRRTCEGDPPVSWEGVDWSRTNGAIAAERGVSPDHVSAARARLRSEGQQIPTAPFPAGRLRERMMARAEAAVERVRPLLQAGLRVGGIAARLGLSHGVAGIAARLAKERPPSAAEPEVPEPRKDGRT